MRAGGPTRIGAIRPQLRRLDGAFERDLVAGWAIAVVTGGSFRAASIKAFVFSCRAARLGFVVIHGSRSFGRSGCLLLACSLAPDRAKMRSRCVPRRRARLPPASRPRATRAPDAPAASASRRVADRSSAAASEALQSRRSASSQQDQELLSTISLNCGQADAFGRRQLSARSPSSAANPRSSTLRSGRRM